MIAKGQSYELKIEDMSAEGQGIGRVEGMTVFGEGGTDQAQEELRFRETYGDTGTLFRSRRAGLLLREGLRRMLPAAHELWRTACMEAENGRGQACKDRRNRKSCRSYRHRDGEALEIPQQGPVPRRRAGSVCRR